MAKQEETTRVAMVRSQGKRVDTFRITCQEHDGSDEIYRSKSQALAAARSHADEDHENTLAFDYQERRR
jgi:hypothetical protein